MCLSVAGEIIEINGHEALVDIMGINKNICIDLIENPCVGDKILIHAGCGISKLTPYDFTEIVEAITLLKDSINE